MGKIVTAGITLPEFESVAEVTAEDKSEIVVCAPHPRRMCAVVFTSVAMACLTACSFCFTLSFVSATLWLVIGFEYCGNDLFTVVED